MTADKARIEELAAATSKGADRLVSWIAEEHALGTECMQQVMPYPCVFC
jgi:hypothetical protein